LQLVTAAEVHSARCRYDVHLMRLMHAREDELDEFDEDEDMLQNDDDFDVDVDGI
jgi:hypothetical protein